MKLEFKNTNQQLQQNKQFLKDFLQDEIIQKGIVKTGALASSVVVEGKETKTGYDYRITMKDYGYFQDSGVRGTIGPMGGKGFTAPNPKSFFEPQVGFTSIIPWKPRSPLPFPAAVAISQRGIQPRPFINYALDRFEKLTGETIQREGIKDVDKSIEGIFLKQGGTVK